jgi:hypothetical protein
MGFEPGDGNRAGDEPDPDHGLPGDGTPGPAPGGARDPRLAGFAVGGRWESRPPSAALAVALAGAAGPGWRCPGASHDELLGLVRAAAALESWASAAKLGLLRAVIREEDLPLSGGDRGGGLPGGWSRSLTHEVALALAMSPVSAENLMGTAQDLAARLPGVGALLEDGTLTYPKARAVNDALELLSPPDRAAAEAMILPDLAGKTFGQVERLAARAAITVDPGIAERSREHAERNKARVVLKREGSGAAMLSGYDLPPAETLAAHAAVCARAQEYKDSKAFPGVLMDQLRAMGYLDLMNGIAAAARIAAGPPDVGLGAPGEGVLAGAGAGGPGREDPDDPGWNAPGRDGPGSDRPDADGHGRGAEARNGVGGSGGGPADCPCRECDGSCLPPADDDEDDDEGGGPDDAGPGDDEPDDHGPDDAGSGGGGPDDGGRSGGSPPVPPPQTPSPPSSPWSSSPVSPPPRLTDLVIPLATLLRLAWRPGESHGFGPLDPSLCVDLAALAVSSPHSAVCVTVTDSRGRAIGHGCLKPGRRAALLPGAPAPPLTGLPARVNLTITATRLSQLADLAEKSRPATGWAFTPPGAPDLHGPPGDPDWCGTWALTLPTGLECTVRLEPVPTHHCDHRRESHAYEPNDALRHLVQVRDYECTFPTCSRHAKESDFEHAIPYHKGGRTCGCNAGARSRRCHQVKQSAGWKVTQPKPGWHRWQTPSGRVYTQEPNRYPV